MKGKGGKRGKKGSLPLGHLQSIERGGKRHYVGSCLAPPAACPSMSCDWVCSTHIHRAPSPPPATGMKGGGGGGFSVPAHLLLAQNPFEGHCEDHL